MKKEPHINRPENETDRTISTEEKNTIHKDPVEEVKGEAPLNVEEEVKEAILDNEEISEDKVKILELEDLLKRQVADFDNFRKRQQEEKLKLKEIAQEAMILDFLGIFDNIERALESSQKEDASMLSITEGLSGIMALFGEFLLRYQIEKLDSIGKPFDPKVHEALYMEEGDYEKQEVIKEVEKAYIRKEKVIRTAKVAVGIPKKNKEN